MKPTHVCACGYLRQQGGDDVQWSLVDGLILQRGSKSHIHQRSNLLQHHVPATWVVQDLTVLVDLFLFEMMMIQYDYTASIYNMISFSVATDCIIL